MSRELLTGLWFALLVFSVVTVIVGFGLSLWYLAGVGLVALGLNLLFWRDYFRNGE